MLPNGAHSILKKCYDVLDNKWTISLRYISTLTTFLGLWLEVATWVLIWWYNDCIFLWFQFEKSFSICWKYQMQFMSTIPSWQCLVFSVYWLLQGVGRDESTAGALGQRHLAGSSRSSTSGQNYFIGASLNPMPSPTTISWLESFCDPILFCSMILKRMRFHEFLGAIYLTFLIKKTH